LPEECRTPAFRDCLSTGENRRACFREVMQSLPDSCRKAISDRAAGQAEALPATFKEHAYGSDERQKLDLARPAGAAKAPVLLFVHGGGWSIGDKRLGSGLKGQHFLGQGWAFASTNYRLVPKATVENQAADVASAVAFLRRQPGLDPQQIVLMGHSAGAHLAALVATDPSYLRAAGVPMEAIRGVILLDGAGYDVAKQMAEPRNLVRTMYEQAFSSDPARQAKLSPVSHAAAPNTTNWLILPVANRRDSLGQSEALAAALRAAGAKAEVKPQAGKSHASINRELGASGDSTTAVVDRWMATLR
jgi:acetyl esterase/lipase